MKYRQLALSLVAGLTVASAQAATPAHSYVFSTGFSDADVSWSNATLSDSGLNVGWDGQVALSNVLSSPEYSLDLVLSLDRTDWQRKVLDFKGLSTDGGLYVDFGQVSLSDNAGAYVASSANVVSALSPVRLTFTRTATGLFSSYVNGALQFSFDDAANLTTFGTSGIFFKDDAAGCGYCQTGGSLAYVNVYDTALSAREVSSIGNPVTPAVPEPESAALLVAGLLTAGTLFKRRQAR
ncbi:MAG: LamG-like jellyroll fold domain-containing protein [Acidobacteriota bacterium]